MTMLYGAIIGDISGSIYEFNNIKEKPAEIMTDGTFFTDDTVMTIAVAESMVNSQWDKIGMYMQDWAKRYPGRGYGNRFIKWVTSYDMKPYFSLGNGSAMRVSPAAWAADSLPEAKYLAVMSAIPTHNHPEGIKGAEAVASAIYLARIGYSKKYIKEYISTEYEYEIPTCDYIRPRYYFNETCPGTVPQAFAAFLESTDFEDCIKLAISLGGDSDTLAAIAGSIAEAYYGVPENLVITCRSNLPVEMVQVLDDFEIMFAQEGK